MDMLNRHLAVILFCSFCFVMMAIRIIQAKRQYFTTNGSDEGIFNDPMLIIMPFRNESILIQNSLSKIINEVSKITNCRLIVVDSASDDNSYDLAKETLTTSNMAPEKWTITSTEEPGKCKALNHAMSKYGGSGIVVMIDADAKIPSGCLHSIRRCFSNSKIGAVSAQEIIHGSHPMREYKIRSNELRRYESLVGSCIALEGSLLAWHPSRINWYEFDESSNADDTQISMATIRSGHRSIIHSSIRYKDSRNDVSNSYKRSIRRSQGLSFQLVKNIDLLWSAPDKNTRMNYLFNVILHLFIPWCVIALVLLPIDFYLSLGEPPQALDPSLSLLPSSIMLISLISSTGRGLLFGAIFSIIGHIRALFGVKANIWTPGRG